MKILTNENVHVDMNELSDEIEDIRFCILDYSDPKTVDYIFIPLLFSESFNAPAIDLRIGKHRVQVPIDWSILVGDKNSGEVEVLSLKQLNDREFDAFTLNPISGYMPHFLDMEIMNVFPDIKWNVPKLRFEHILAVPIEDGESPLCIYLIKDVKKIPECLDITQLV